jgi:hypothetical protein
MFVVHKGWCLFVGATSACHCLPYCSVPMGTKETEAWLKIESNYNQEKTHGER